ncbi:hypothetical protein ACVSUK_16625 [Yersinia enterocolitica]
MTEEQQRIERAIWCTNVHKGSDLERLYAEMESSIELLNQRRNS